MGCHTTSTIFPDPISISAVWEASTHGLSPISVLVCGLTCGRLGGHLGDMAIVRARPPRRTKPGPATPAKVAPVIAVYRPRRGQRRGAAGAPDPADAAADEKVAAFLQRVLRPPERR
jgi:hypothetical protein